MAERLLTINGREAPPAEERAWKEERRRALLEKQSARGDPSMTTWNAAFSTPKIHRRKRHAGS